MLNARTTLAAAVLAALLCLLVAPVARGTTVWGRAEKMAGAGCLTADPAQQVTVKRSSTGAIVAQPSPDALGDWSWTNCTSDHYDTILIDSYGNTRSILGRYEYGACAATATPTATPTPTATATPGS